MNKMNAPELEVVRFTAEDVIATSETGPVVAPYRIKINNEFVHECNYEVAHCNFDKISGSNIHIVNYDETGKATGFNSNPAVSKVKNKLRDYNGSLDVSKISGNDLVGLWVCYENGCYYIHDSN